jgi:formylglycine-generating enzyme
MVRMGARKRIAAVVAVVWSVAAWSVACTDLGDLSGGGQGADASVDGATPLVDGGTSDAATGDGGTTQRCKGSKGPTPVRYGKSCIDATEVSNAQFAEFHAATAGDAGAQPASCVGAPMTPGAGFWPKSDAQPVRYIGWCAARAYCAWAGKRLCGRIGGGELDPNEGINAYANEWYAACSQTGTRKYPYGDAFDPEACQSNLRDGGGGPYGDVGSLPACQGPPGVYDLSGSMWEWIDQCATQIGPDGGTERRCVMRGGSYAVNKLALACAGDYAANILNSSTDVGIRCCSDLE